MHRLRCPTVEEDNPSSGGKQSEIDLSGIALKYAFLISTKESSSGCPSRCLFVENSESNIRFASSGGVLAKNDPDSSLKVLISHATKRARTSTFCWSRLLQSTQRVLTVIAAIISGCERSMPRHTCGLKYIRSSIMTAITKCLGKSCPMYSS